MTSSESSRRRRFRSAGGTEGQRYPHFYSTGLWGKKRILSKSKKKTNKTNKQTNFRLVQEHVSTSISSSRDCALGFTIFKTFFSPPRIPDNILKCDLHFYCGAHCQYRLVSWKSSKFYSRPLQNPSLHTSCYKVRNVF